MKTSTNGLIFRCLTLLAGLALAAAGPAPRGPLPAAPGVQTHFVYLPVVRKPTGCPSASGNSYHSGIMYQVDNDNPVRPAWNHADKNLALRGYASNPAALPVFKDYGSTDPIQPPQLATLFSPNRVPPFTGAYRVYNWAWHASPDQGVRGTLDTLWDVTVLGLQTTPGEQLHAPTHGRNLGDDFGPGGSMVIYADANSLTLKFTRDDSAASGYTVHLDNICTDPNLLALYNSLDNTARNTYSATPGYSYNLPGLTVGEVLGTARDGEIRVAIVDTGAFMDPRSCGDWWQIRLGTNCP